MKIVPMLDTATDLIQSGLHSPYGSDATYQVKLTSFFDISLTPTLNQINKVIKRIAEPMRLSFARVVWTGDVFPEYLASFCDRPEILSGAVA